MKISSENGERAVDECAMDDQICVQNTEELLSKRQAAVDDFAGQKAQEQGLRV